MLNTQHLWIYSFNNYLWAKLYMVINVVYHDDIFPIFSTFTDIYSFAQSNVKRLNKPPQPQKGLVMFFLCLKKKWIVTTQKSQSRPLSDILENTK